MGAIYINIAVKEETSGLKKNHNVAEALGANDRTKEEASWFCQPHGIHPASESHLLFLQLMWEHPDQSPNEGLDGPSCEKLLIYPQLVLRYAFKNLEDLPATVWIFLQKSALFISTPLPTVDKNGFNILMGKRKAGGEHSQEPLQIEKLSFWPRMKMGKSAMFSASD